MNLPESRLKTDNRNFYKDMEEVYNKINKNDEK